MSEKLTKAQRALLGRLTEGQVLVTYRRPGAEDKPWACYIEHPYSNEDGRTVGSIIDRRFVGHEGGGLWIITPAGRAALSKDEGGAG